MTGNRQRRLALVPVTADDIAFYGALFSDPVMYAHRPDPTPDSAERLAEVLRADLRHWQTHGFGRWRLRDGPRDVGLGGLSACGGYDGLNISYHIHPDAWRRGYASEFVAMALDHAFGELGAQRVYGLVRPANPASIRVLEKAGFSRTGTVIFKNAPSYLMCCSPAP